jgi:HEAT repeat protein
MLTDPPEQVADRQVLLDRLTFENDAHRLAEIVLEVGRLHGQETLASLAALQHHPSAMVRRAVAEALPMAMVSGAASGVGVDALIGLCSDEVAEVRDWAACSLGRTLAENRHQLQAFYDTPDIRAALWARLADEDPATRAEACAGLAFRHVHDVVGPLLRELARPDVGRVPVIAAEALRSSELLGPLLALQHWWTRDPELLERAIAACTDGPSQRTPGSNHG